MDELERKIKELKKKKRELKKMKKHVSEEPATPTKLSRFEPPQPRQAEEPKIKIQVPITSNQKKKDP